MYIVKVANVTGASEKVIRLYYVVLFLSLFIDVTRAYAEERKHQDPVLEYRAGQQIGNDPVLGDSLAISYWVYNNEFADRFSLDKPQEDLLDDDIYAIEMRFFKSPYTVAPYHCSFNVFYKNTIPIDFPELESGDEHAIDLSLQIPHNANLSRIEDRRYLAQKRRQYREAGKLEFLNNGKMASFSISLNSYRNNYLNDMSWASYEISCGIVNYSIYSASDAWYLSVPRINNEKKEKGGESVNRIRLPVQLVKNFTDIAKRSAIENSKNVKHYRESRGMIYP